MAALSNSVSRASNVSMARTSTRSARPTLLAFGLREALERSTASVTGCSASDVEGRYADELRGGAIPVSMEYVADGEKESFPPSEGVALIDVNFSRKMDAR
jgi:hypothetical protein